MAEFVVDGLEVVQVEEQDRHAAVAGPHHGVLQTLGEQRSVGESRQRVVEGLMLELLVGRAQLAYAVQRAIDVATRHVAHERHCRRDHECPDQTNPRVGVDDGQPRGNERGIPRPHSRQPRRPPVRAAALQLGCQRQRQGQTLEVERQACQRREAGHHGEHRPIERGDGADEAYRQSEGGHAAEGQTVRVLAQPAVRMTCSSESRVRLDWPNRVFRHRVGGHWQGGQPGCVDRLESHLVAAFRFHVGKRGLRRLEQLRGRGVLTVDHRATDAHGHSRLFDAVRDLVDLLGRGAANTLRGDLRLGKVRLG